MNGKNKVVLALGALIMALAVILKLSAVLSVEQFSVMLAVGFMVFMHPLDYKKREINNRDEFVRRVNLTSMARSWRATQLLVVALIFGTVLHWVTWQAIWSLILISVFMLVTYILFLIPLFNKGEVE